MIRVAFTIIGGDNWTGGHHYLHNLLRVLTAEFSERIEPVLFVAEAGGSRGIGDFEALDGLEIVATPLLHAKRGRLSLVQSIFWGRDSSLVRLFNEQRIDLVFEAAQFYGWRLGIPAIAWIPDFQHLSLPQMFSATGRWKREIGFRAQMFGGRRIMLSSDDARRICLKHYALAESRTRTVHFAVPAGTRIPLEEARRVADEYDLPGRFFYMPNQLWRHKNHGLVIEALGLLRQRGTPVFIAASGKQSDPRDPGLFERLTARVEQLGVADSIRFLGLIPYPHLMALMRASCGLLNPSLSEGWSTTVEEARSMGVPMLLSDLDVHQEQMGDLASYFERDSADSLADALLRFPLVDEPRRATMIEHARQLADERVRRFGEDFTRLAEDCVTENKTS